MSDHDDGSGQTNTKVVIGFQTRRRRPRYASEASSRFLPAAPLKGRLARALERRRQRAEYQARKAELEAAGKSDA